MVQSYIDEYVWRYNNNCTTNREQSYELILREITKNFTPGQKLNEFEDRYEKCVPTDNEYFDFDSQSESDSQSETNSESDLSDFDNVYTIDNNLRICNENVIRENLFGEGDDEGSGDNESSDDDDDENVEHEKSGDGDDETATIAGKSISGSSTLNQNGLSDSVCDAD